MKKIIQQKTDLKLENFSNDKAPRSGKLYL